MTSLALSSKLEEQCVGRSIGVTINARKRAQDLDGELAYVPIEREPVIAKWELWTVANMLISSHGDGAEAHATEKLAEARAAQDEGGEIVWEGVITQLARMRAKSD